MKHRWMIALFGLGLMGSAHGELNCTGTDTHCDLVELQPAQTFVARVSGLKKNHQLKLTGQDLLNTWYVRTVDNVCLDAACYGDDCDGQNGGRTGYDFALNILQSDKPTGEHTLKSDAGTQLPVQFALRSDAGVGLGGSALKNGAPLNINAIRSTGHGECKSKTYQLIAAIKTTDIERLAKERLYRGFYELQLESSFDGRAPHRRVLLPFNIDLNITPAVEVKGIDDHQLSSKKKRAISTDTFCVFTLGTDNFTIDVSSSVNNKEPTPGSAFHLLSDRRNNHSLDFQVEISDRNGVRETYRYNSKKSNAVFSSQLQQRCEKASDNMTLEVRLLDDLVRAPAGNYRSTVTVTVAAK